MRTPPTIDRRTAADILAAVSARLEQQWPGLSADPFAAAVSQVFARYCGVIIERLNRVPVKNHLAFLDLLGLSPVPPAPASAALNFEPVRQLPRGGGTVPQYTQVAAAGPSGPVVFETRRSLELTAARLERVISFDPREGRHAEHPALLSTEGSAGEEVFAGDSSATHQFFLAQDQIFSSTGLSELRLQITLESALDPSRQPRIQWFIPTPDGEILLTPAADTTRELSRSGDVVFRNLPSWPTRPVAGRNTCWLGCRRLPALVARENRFPRARLPRILAVSISASRRVEKRRITQACCNGQTLDLSKDFYPLGEAPRFGDVWYMSSPEFAHGGAELALDIVLTNPATAGDKSPIRVTTREGNPAVQWESWNGECWLPLACRDGSLALTENGAVSFRMPATVAETLVAGLKGHWLRARLVNGHYRVDQSDRGPISLPGAAAPSIRGITVTSSLEFVPRPPDAVLVHDSVQVAPAERGAGHSFEPFPRVDLSARCLYLGFRAEAAIAGPRLDLHFLVAESGATDVSGNGVRRRRLRWQGWNGRTWMELAAGDDTHALARSGMIVLSLPEPLVPWQASWCDPELCWVRVLRPYEENSPCPILQRISLNTVTAEHIITLDNEDLGSGSGQAHQLFRAARTPIVGEVRLEVREQSMPASEFGAVDNSRAPGRRLERWTPWQEVADFLTSGPMDRHFVVDRLSGEIRFGDGLHGLIPPTGGNNIRLARYQSGGGVVGNLPKHSLTQLRSGVPFVKSVTNLDPATGGLDRENTQAMLERGSRRLRHRSRAVTAEDYEDLALEASPAVAKAKCFPFRGITDGAIILAVVAHDAETRPGDALLGRVKTFLDQRRAPFGELVVVPPTYVGVSVRAEVAAVSDRGAAALVEVCEQRLSRFLDPLIGGDEGRGWPFGSLPKTSDLYSVLERIPELAYVHRLAVQTTEERPGLLQEGTYLIRSGLHQIKVVV